MILIHDYAFSTEVQFRVQNVIYIHPARRTAIVLQGTYVWQERHAPRWSLPECRYNAADGGSTDVLVKRGKTVADVVEASMIASAPQIKERTLAGYRSL